MGEVVYYYYPIKGKQPKEAYFKWTGPFVVTEVFGSVYRIQKSLRSKSLVVNHDSLKPAKLRAPLDTAWAADAAQKRREATAEEAEEVLEPSSSQSEQLAAGGARRPRRQVKPPNMYGNWLLE